MNEPDDALIREILALRPLSVTELRARYLALFGEETASRNKDYLFKRIAYRMQEQKYGGLSRAAVARAELLGFVHNAHAALEYLAHDLVAKLVLDGEKRHGWMLV